MITMNSVTWSPGMTLGSLEKAVILAAYRYFKGNKTQTASALGIAVRTLDYKLDEYKVNNEKQEVEDAKSRAEREAFLKRQRGFHTTVEGRIVLNVDDASAKRFAEAEAQRGRVTKAGHQSASSSIHPETGVHMEPASDASKELAVSVPIREEIQEVPHGRASEGGSKKRR